MERKYGETVAEVLSQQQKMQEEYDNYVSLDEQVAKTGAEHKRLLAQYRQLARQLTEARHGLANEFEKNMMAQLKDLGMGQHHLPCRSRFARKGRFFMPQSVGDDVIEFMISPNPRRTAEAAVKNRVWRRIVAPDAGD